MFAEDREYRKQVVDTEIAAWQKVLGVTLDPNRMSGVPFSVTPEYVATLAENGFGVRFIPQLAIHLGDLRPGRDVNEFVDGLQTRYPNWKRYENLSDQEKADPAVCRNLKADFWEFALKGQITFKTFFRGEWVAVETIAKPPAEEDYPKSPVTEALRLPNRFQSRNTIIDALRSNKHQTIKGVDLKVERAWLLDIIDYNLLANREGWGLTDGAEWTSTDFRLNFDTTMGIMAGSSRVGGAAGFYTEHLSSAVPETGFRVAISI